MASTQRRVIFEIDVTFTDTWGQVETKDLLKVFLDKSAGIKSISIKKTNKRKLEGK